MVDGRGRPLSILLTEGQAGDNPQLLALLDRIAVNTPGPGAPRKRPDVLIADKGYAHASTRRVLRRLVLIAAVHVAPMIGRTGPGRGDATWPAGRRTTSGGVLQGRQLLPDERDGSWPA
ncbi:hypothetical protein GCM10010532_045180 [Dactylosporangium siamense]|uniref:Transposase IS4-like domain-containing protein n=1 Tax=Dactylosporangium siamense TaxID=685454 RepID=A0A919PKR1_9ACTN|nr:hypothetical protein Dsi01nite_033730 [Dactylosporangium siamense]